MSSDADRTRSRPLVLVGSLYSGNLIAVRLLVDVIDADNVVFASEMIGAVRSADARTGHYFERESA